VVISKYTSEISHLNPPVKGKVQFFIPILQNSFQLTRLDLNRYSYVMERLTGEKNNWR
jgi:hypothetical protein